MSMWLYPFAKMTDRLRLELPDNDDHKWSIDHTTQWYMIGKGRHASAVLGIAPPVLLGDRAWLWGYKLQDLAYEVSDFRAGRKLFRLLIHASPYKLYAFTDDKSPMLGHFSRWLGWKTIGHEADKTFYEVI